jgi:NAD(P)-dependent dehydrogenase (short-subunit alcohol dehydrogenase family)
MIVMAVPTVLITGALTGIGRATAFAFARDGANVVVSGRREDAGDRLAKELADVGGQAEFVRADVRFDEDLRRLVDRAVERFGRIDVAFNNAGVDAAVPIAEVTEGAYADIFDTNVRGTLLSVKHEFRVMRESGGGSIINSSSTYGLMGYPAASLYSGSKHAVIGITKSAALEGASFKIRVNAVAPGFTTTAMYERATGDDATREVLNSVLPLGRAGDPDEVAAAVQFLGSGRAAYITGQVLTLDGGLMAGWPLFPSAA